LAIFIKVKCHSLLRIGQKGNKLMFSFLMINNFLSICEIYQFFELIVQKIYFIFSKQGLNPMQILSKKR
jgi:hypothetical protein